LNDPAHLLACEARFWLEHEGWNADRIEARLASIAQKRGQAGADRLREAMRKEWAARTAERARNQKAS